MKCRTRFLVIAIVIGATILSDAADLREISGEEAEALALALKVFKSKQGSKDEHGNPVYGELKHYTVDLTRDGDKLEIDFGPEFGPKDKGPDGMPKVGGATQYGWEIVYVVSLKEMKLLEEHYSR